MKRARDRIGRAESVSASNSESTPKQQANQRARTAPNLSKTFSPNSCLSKSSLSEQSHQSTKRQIEKEDGKKGRAKWR